MLHSKQLSITRPGDSQKECGFLKRFHFMLDRGSNSDKTASLQIVCLPLCGVTHDTSEHLNGSRAVDMMLLQPGGVSIEIRTTRKSSLLYRVFE